MTGRDASSPLVDIGWLAAHRDEVVLLHASIARSVGDKGETVFADGRPLFEQAHIPGAQVADLFDGFSELGAPFLFTRPTVAGIEAAARRVGIDDHSTVVVYDALGGAWAARVWWVLQSVGLDSVSVLDGGLQAWTASGREVASGPAMAPSRSGTFTARERDGFFVDLGAVKAIALGPQASRATPLVCGVRAAEYRGDERPRSGHIPGSVSLPYPDLLDGSGLIDAAAVRKALAERDLDRQPKLILYCGGGINASGLALALTEAGFEGDLAIYDGSLNEWRADPSLPLARGDDGEPSR